MGRKESRGERKEGKSKEVRMREMIFWGKQAEKWSLYPRLLSSKNTSLSIRTTRNRTPKQAGSILRV
jgi:hypothetical protein